MNGQTEDSALKTHARRAYELGRLRAAARGALLVATVCALLGSLLLGRAALVWAPLTFLLWLWLGFRGGPLLRGARYGLLAGGLTLLLPMSLLRPCCRFDETGMASCTMPEMCVALGVLVGLPLSVLLLSRREPQRLVASLGMWLGVLSAASFKCSALFAGEALGLLGGLALGVLTANAVSMLGARTRTV
jgi:hypothetical protein